MPRIRTRAPPCVKPQEQPLSDLWKHVLNHTHLLLGGREQPALGGLEASQILGVLEMLGGTPDNEHQPTISDSSPSSRTSSTEATTPQESSNHQRNGANMVSSGIMRSEQTLMLVQLYHRNHRTMTSCSHDVEGRKTKQQLWTEIAHELNSKFDTLFSVEQFKKKLQNIQCTARMKIQSEKRNRNHGIASSQKYSQAELEFIRLFEQHNAPQNMFNPEVPVGNMLESLGIYTDENGYHLGHLSNGDSGENSTTTTLDESNASNVAESDSEAAQQLLLALGVSIPRTTPEFSTQHVLRPKNLNRNSTL
ncbi:hypothetical protein L596_012210 [Steinernema carpocapsae]|uniref:Regulatory protein zeste n=1 Tax=Steinernema carpocapsae TaxID=34508 RepID=A0A4U5NWA7_STECR|nr:hypothetical protein L596_012210 [Steinernema carpocapsae]